ncbi:hypothetical protein DFH09DRAFT_1190058 [Mycena vulgaris]|nr:hypothetical protein DFH09DRAFT_1190058 [Mycena vulgaris]
MLSRNVPPYSQIIAECKFLPSVFNWDEVPVLLGRSISVFEPDRLRLVIELPHQVTIGSFHNPLVFTGRLYSPVGRCRRVFRQLDGVLITPRRSMCAEHTEDPEPIDGLARRAHDLPDRHIWVTSEDADGALRISRGQLAVAVVQDDPVISGDHLWRRVTRDFIYAAARGHLPLRSGRCSDDGQGREAENQQARDHFGRYQKGRVRFLGGGRKSRMESAAYEGTTETP